MDMFGLNLMSIVADTTESNELNNRCRSKKLRRNLTSQISSGMSDHSTRKTDQVEVLKIPEYHTLMNTDDDVQLRHGYSKRSRERKNELRKIYRFHNELEITQRNVDQDVYQERASGMKEDDDSYEFMNNFGCWAEEPEVDEDETNDIEEPKLCVRKTGRRLERELRKANRLLAFERSQKHALQGRLVDIENQMRARNSQVDEDYLNKKYGQTMQILQKEVKECRDEVELERRRANEMEEKLKIAQQENAKSLETMRLLMFNHIPSVSPRFKDIGPVNYGIEEVSGRVGDYELGKILGEGHYGMVQVGTDVNTRQAFAVKVLSKDRVRRFKDLEQMAMEVHVLKRYPHPNIIRLREVVHAPDNIYLVTELCLMDIHQFHNDASLSEEGAKHVILGILKPLEYLHSHGICHLDLKPENILISRSADLQNVSYKDIRLCDFGLVSMAKKPEKNKEVYRQGYACGTPGFFAPEMILKREFEGRLADMWSLGCIILELTLGFTQEWVDSYELIDEDPRGFQAGLEECLEAIPIEKYPLHHNLLDIIHFCLKIEPASRINSRYALQHPWIASITMADENREDSGHSRHGSGSPSGCAERQEFLGNTAACW